MRYPNMMEITRQTMSTENWMGYHHALRISDGESYDEINMGAEEYPILAPRRKRGIFQRPGNCQGIIAKDNLCWIDGSKFVMNGMEYEMHLSQEPRNCPKELISMGAYVIILPDKKYINTTDTSDSGNIEAQTVTSGAVTFALCREDGGEYENIDVSDTAPTEPADGKYWVDTGSTPNALKKWSSAESMWVEVGTTYVKISASGIGTAYKDMDGVSISGLEGSQNEELKALMGSQVIWKRSDNWILIIGILGRAETVTTPVTIERRMPNMDFVIESGNRLWGCRYGTARNGQIVNEVYASCQGDFKNWNRFLGISTDSWVGNCGTDGQWTGAYNYLGYPIFFKADHIHKVYGNLPSQFRIQDTAARGVQKGSSKSLAMVNEVLIYKSRTGVCAYDGSLPSDIGEALGQESYSEAVAGAHGSRYYISMIDDKTQQPVLMTYDIKKNIWHKEDGLRARVWASARNELYCINDVTGEIVAVTGAGEPERDFYWETITGEIGLKQNSGFAIVAAPDEKYLGKLMLRMMIADGAEVDVWIQYDGLGDWEHLAKITSSSARSFRLPIKPRRCDWLRLKISGTGFARVYSLVKYIEGGSDKTDSESMTLDF